MTNINFRINQKVKVRKNIRNDGTCCGCSKGGVIAYEGAIGYVCDITEFLFERVIVVHFIEKNKKIGFREHELEILEDFDLDTGKWVKII